MFDSGITAETLITEIQNEADIAPDIPIENYVQWLNSVEQLLYSEVIKEQKKYTFDIASPLVKSEINLWPLFDNQTVGDIELTVTEDGKYKVHTTNGSDHAITGATFTKNITLPAGDYVLSDNGTAYYSAYDKRDYRTIIKDAVNGHIYAYLEPLDGSNDAKPFTLTKDTLVTLCVRVFPGAPFVNGYSYWPQLMRGSEKTPFVKPERRPSLVCGYPVYDSEAAVRFEDVHAVYVDGRQLIKTTLASGAVFADSYYKDDNHLGLRLLELPVDMTVVYAVRPRLKTPGTIITDTVKVPVEFIDLVKAKLRGEAYKLANEDSLAAKWLSDYNILLETFKMWAANKQPEFGL